MSEKMAALVVTELCKKAELMDMPRPECDDDGVIVKTAYSGVSVGTEMWIAHGKRSDYGEVPFINGYQATGQIVETGKDVDGLKDGDWVYVFCRGSHSPYVAAKAEYTHVLAKGDQYAEVASIWVQYAVGSNAISTAGVNAGDTALVVGQGIVGQATAQLLQLRGAFVVASDVSPQRLAISAAHCSDWSIDASNTLVSEQIKEKFEWGVDIVFESTGFERLLNDAMSCVNGHGKFVFEGFYPGNVTYNFSIGHAMQFSAYYPSFVGSRANREAIGRLIESGRLNVAPLVTHLTQWQQSEELYNKLFTDERDSMNGIVFDWRDA